MRVRSVRLALAVTSVLAGAVPGAASASPVVVIFDRTVATAESYQDAVVVLGGTIDVAPGASLTLSRSTVHRLPETRISVSGALRLRDVAMPANPEAGIHVLAAGRLEAERVTAEGVAIEVDGRAEISSSTLSGTRTSALLVRGSATLRSLSITQTMGFALWLDGGEVDASGLEVSGAGSFGVNLEDATFRAQGMEIENTLDYGLRAWNSTVEIDGARLRGHCGVYLGNGTTATITGAAFTTSAHGLTVTDGSDLTISSSSFSGGSDGLSSYSSRVMADAIEVAGADRGVISDGSTGVFTSSRFGPNGVDIDIDGALVPTVSSSAFDPASQVGVTNRTAIEVDARGNFWGGEPNAPGSARTLGPVLVVPWLGAPPA